MNSTSEEKIEQLQREINSLQQVIGDTQKEIDSNRLSINKMYRMADLLQSYIPERGKWREAYRERQN
jgi:peptidoglycan hydrolase CwlO-like protein